LKKTLLEGDRNQHWTLTRAFGMKTKPKRKPKSKPNRLGIESEGIETMICLGGKKQRQAGKSSGEMGFGGKKRENGSMN
jgi:hypothetical protein